MTGQLLSGTLLESERRPAPHRTRGTTVYRSTASMQCNHSLANSTATSSFGHPTAGAVRRPNLVQSLEATHTAGLTGFTGQIKHLKYKLGIVARQLLQRALTERPELVGEEFISGVCGRGLDGGDGPKKCSSVAGSLICSVYRSNRRVLAASKTEDPNLPEILLVDLGARRSVQLGFCTLKRGHGKL